MDSRMLNVFHEDPFEGNFVKYDPESNFWSANDDLQLTDTLNGILPIAPTDESFLSENTAEEQLHNNKNLLIYSDFVEQQLSDDADVRNGQIYKQQRQLTVLVNSEDEEDAGESLEEDDIHSQCSNSTFRTRTDSSSIGDYESHSSDYDDEIDDYPDVNVAGKENQLKTDAFAYEEDRKNRTLSTNTISSEVDALGLNIDVNNFDLADFITKDDFGETLSSLRTKCVPSAVHLVTSSLKLDTVKITADKPKEIKAASPQDTVLPKPVIISKSRDSDYDSDSIIDVETVDVVDIDESLYKNRENNKLGAVDDLCYVDNVKDDPSWSPNQTKRLITAENKTVTANNKLASKATSASVPLAAGAAGTAAKPKVVNNICLVPNKKQCDFLKRKVGAKAPGSLPISKTKVTAKKIQEANNSVVGKQQQALAKTTQSLVLNTGLGLGGKNLALLKQAHNASAVTPSDAATPAPKRKLNLEEYKQRRCGAVVPIKVSSAPKPLPVKQAKLETSKTTTAPKPIPVQQSSPHKAAISSIVNSLKCPTRQVCAATDPITVAKNKVLRMLELKRAQQLKILDSRVTAKVPRVTKLPPLKDIVKDTYCMEIEKDTVVAPVQATPSSKLQADYEEIIIVSASCNTDITIPPQQASVALRDNKTTTPSSRSLLRSSVLLYNISNGSEACKDMTNSLIASIQSEVVKQTSCEAVANPTITATGAVKSQTNKNEHHGEDKVIMHLAKNRVRKSMVSIGTQTDLQPEFPLLTLPTTRQSRQRTRRNYRKRRGDGSAANESSCSNSSSSTCSSIASYRSRSNSNSMERLRHSDAAPACGSSIGGGGYSSRSTRRHRSSISSSSFSEAGKYDRQQRQRQRRTSYNKRRSKNQARGNCSTSGSEYSDRERSRSPHRRPRSRSTSVTRYANNQNNNRGYVDRNVSQPAVEERRIVYVGRIEAETTKEILRRKFLPYGSIKQITIHYKDTGMKYGFVTFERAQDAFTAIDTSPRDALINMYDISFGGRRAFCRASYADLDNAGINNYESYVFPKAASVAPPEEDSFEALLLKMKAKLNANKPTATQTTTATEEPTGATTAANINANNNSGINQI